MRTRLQLPWLRLWLGLPRLFVRVLLLFVLLLVLLFVFLLLFVLVLLFVLLLLLLLLRVLDRRQLSDRRQASVICGWCEKFEPFGPCLLAARPRNSMAAVGQFPAGRQPDPESSHASGVPELSQPARTFCPAVRIRGGILTS